MLGVIVIVVMLLLTVLWDRFDAWMRGRGFGWMLSGNRTYTVVFLWVFRVCLAAIGVYLVVLFFEGL